MKITNIYTYYDYDPRLSMAQSMEMALRWKASWMIDEWRPTELSGWTARANPLFSVMLARLIAVQAKQPLINAYMRWLAMAADDHEGYLAHIDCLNNGLRPARHTVRNSIICFDRNSDCLVWATSKMYNEFVAVLMDALANPIPPHPWQVLLSWHGCFIQDAPDLVSHNDPSTRIHHLQINHP